MSLINNFDNEIDVIKMRRKILDWRDEQIEKIEHHIHREIHLLFNEIDEKIDTMSKTELLDSQNFANNNIKPIFEQWFNNEVFILLKDADQSLHSVCQFSVARQRIDTSFQSTSAPLLNAQDIVSVVGAGASLVGATFLRSAAITTVASTATTTGLVGTVTGAVSAATTTVASWLGLSAATTTATTAATWTSWLGLGAAATVSWPILIAGGITMGSVLLFSGTQLAHWRKDKINRYKPMIHETIKNDIKTKIPQLQGAIRETAKMLIQSLEEIR